MKNHIDNLWSLIYVKFESKQVYGECSYHIELIGELLDGFNYSCDCYILLSNGFAYVDTCDIEITKDETDIYRLFTDFEQNQLTTEVNHAVERQIKLMR